jgi:hypothetical protein
MKNTEKEHGTKSDEWNDDDDKRPTSPWDAGDCQQEGGGPCADEDDDEEQTLVGKQGRQKGPSPGVKRDQQTGDDEADEWEKTAGPSADMGYMLYQSDGGSGDPGSASERHPGSNDDRPRWSSTRGRRADRSATPNNKRDVEWSPKRRIETGVVTKMYPKTSASFYDDAGRKCRFTPNDYVVFCDTKQMAAIADFTYDGISKSLKCRIKVLVYASDTSNRRRDYRTVVDGLPVIVSSNRWETIGKGRIRQMRPLVVHAEGIMRETDASAWYDKHSVALEDTANCPPAGYQSYAAPSKIVRKKAGAPEADGCAATRFILVENPNGDFLLEHHFKTPPPYALLRHERPDGAGSQSTAPSSSPRNGPANNGAVGHGVATHGAPNPRCGSPPGADRQAAPACSSSPSSVPPGKCSSGIARRRVACADAGDPRERPGRTVGAAAATAAPPVQKRQRQDEAPAVASAARRATASESTAVVHLDRFSCAVEALVDVMADPLVREAINAVVAARQVIGGCPKRADPKNDPRQGAPRRLRGSDEGVRASGAGDEYECDDGNTEYECDDGNGNSGNDDGNGSGGNDDGNGNSGMIGCGDGDDGNGNSENGCDGDGDDDDDDGNGNSGNDDATGGSPAGEDE